MSRPLRIEFPGAVYHITSRGDRREPIFADDADRKAFLDVLGTAMDRFDAQVLAYCLMGNHYHLGCSRGRATCPADAPRQWRLHPGFQAAACTVGAPAARPIQGDPGRS